MHSFGLQTVWNMSLLRRNQFYSAEIQAVDEETTNHGIFYIIQDLYSMKDTCSCTNMMSLGIGTRSSKHENCEARSYGSSAIIICTTAIRRSIAGQEVVTGNKLYLYQQPNRLPSISMEVR